MEFWWACSKQSDNSLWIVLGDPGIAIAHVTATSSNFWEYQIQHASIYYSTSGPTHMLTIKWLLTAWKVPNSLSEGVRPQLKTYIRKLYIILVLFVLLYCIELSTHVYLHRPAKLLEAVVGNYKL